MNIGFIGLGIMGQPMALHLLRAGHQLHVYARRPDSAESTVAAGATLELDCAALAAACETTFVMVSDTPDVETVLTGPRGVIEGARPDSVVIDMSTISPRSTRELAATFRERRVHMLDAPVSGGEKGAREATLSIMVGGAQPIFERVLPLLRHLGKNIVHIGDSGAGQTAKACNQLLVAQTIAAVAEALVFAQASGVDPLRVREALLGGFAFSRILELHGERMLKGDYRPGFKARLHQKDLRIVMDAAREMGLSLPGAAQSAQYLNRLAGRGDGELDSAAIARIVEGANGLDLDQNRR